MDEERKKRLEDLKQQSLELEKEAQEREKRNEERKKAREEQQRLAAEQEKKDEEERLKKQKEREERRKKREEDEKILKEEMEKLESDKANRITSPKTPTSSIALSPSNSSYSISENSGGDSSSTLLSAQAISAKEEREKRRKELEEEAKKLELEQQRIREEREKRKEERRLQQEEEQRKLQELLDKKESDKIERSKQQEQQEQQEKELANKLEKERSDKELVDKQQEKERLEKEEKEKQEEKERLEKELKEKELKDKLEKEKLEKEEKERLEKEKKEKEEKELAEKLAAEQKEKEEKEQKEKQQEKERQEKELSDKLAKEQKEKEEKEQKEKEEKERQEKELSDKLAKEQKEKEEKELALKLEKELQEKELADKLAKDQKEKEEKELAEKLAKDQKEKEEKEKEKQEKELADKLEKEKLEKEEKELAEKLAIEQKEKEEKQQKELKEKEEKDLADKLVSEQKEKEEKERLEKEVKEKEEKEAAEATAKKQKEEKEKQEKEAAEAAAKQQKEKEENERLEKEKQEKEAAEAATAKQEKEKEENERLEKEKKEKEAKEKEEKVKQEQEAATAKQQKEKEEKEKERIEKEKKEKELKLKQEKEQKEKELKLKQEREFAEKEERDRLEREKISKSVEKETKSSSITDQFKLSIEKQLQNQLENKKKPTAVTEDNNNNSTSTLSSLTRDRAKIKGRQAPSKSHKVPGSTITSSNNESTTSSNEPSLLSKALENNNSNESSPTTKKKIVLPPGAVGGIMGSMASLAMEAQRKKMEIDNNKLLSNVLKDEPAAPNFVRGRSQSVSVTSTLKQDPNKFLNHKKSVDTYSGLRARLIHCKGKKRILTKEVEISLNSLNKMDAFVLDCGIENSNVGGESVDSNSHSTIFTWYGSKSTANKKAKAVAIAEIIKSHERGGHATIIKLDEGDDNELFYKRIGGDATHKSTINPDGGDDLEAELNWASSFTLLKYNSDNDQLVNVETKSLSMELLASDSYYILDTVSEFYEWSGRNVDQSLKDSFHKKCQERLKNNKHRQPWVESVLLSEGGETVLFREKFFDWPDLSHEVSLQRMGFGKKRVFDVSIPYEKKSPAKMNQFEVREMIEIERAEEILKSDGSGEYEIWYIENCKSYPLPKEEYGHFFSGCCYLIRYTYTKWNALKYAIYYWQGADASRQDVGSSSLLSKDLYIETSARGECSQDPERQGRETNHFNMIFNGRMVVHRGDRDSYQFNTTDSARMYHVFGKRSNTITASQTTKSSSTSLNSRDCFIVTDGSNLTYIWESKGSSKQLKEESSKLASLSNSISKSKTNPTITIVKEGSEPDQFWKLIGGNGKYANFDYIHQNIPTDWENQIKLFAVVNTGTIIRADEIYRFSQYDLTPSKVYLLDNRKNIFVWSGLRAQEKEKKRGMEIAIDYVKYLDDSRSENDVLFITQGEEPLAFTSYFHCWDSFRLNSNNNNNNSSNNNIADGADEIADGASPKNAVNLLKKYYQVLPFEKLIEKNTPPEIDRSVLEMYLSDEDFEKHLGSRAEWDALPAWKKTEKKKVSGLF
ncbi:hypothetical protein RB653_006617 [Dictyostelium firmibasis]|uniref:HP domain-containing protein n=1 Tax=Dictyostelium firmibasis TaxID=79012 RepID=A0AAN7TME1_9MYCE